MTLTPFFLGEIDLGSFFRFLLEFDISTIFSMALPQYNPHDQVLFRFHVKIGYFPPKLLPYLHLTVFPFTNYYVGHKIVCDLSSVLGHKVRTQYLNPRNLAFRGFSLGRYNVGAIRGLYP